MFKAIWQEQPVPIVSGGCNPRPYRTARSGGVPALTFLLLFCQVYSSKISKLGKVTTVFTNPSLPIQQRVLKFGPQKKMR